MNGRERTTYRRSLGSSAGAFDKLRMDAQRAPCLLTSGDIAGVRLLLERAANARDATAAFQLARTYDPAVLGARDTRSITRPCDGARLVPQGGELWLARRATRFTQFQN